jgi:hypothetical protein
MSLIEPLIFACALLAPAASGCGAEDYGPTPVISDLTLQSPDPSDTTRIHGTVHVTDPAGLTLLTVNLTVSGNGPTQVVTPIPVDTPVIGQLEATVGFKLASKADFASGTYQVTVTVTEAGMTSNALTSPMLVE